MRLIFFWCASFCLSNSVSLDAQSKALEKIILFNSDNYASISHDGKIYKHTTNEDSLPKRSNNNQIFGMPTEGSFKSSPLAWDIVDSFLIQIRLFIADGTGMTFAQLRQYDMQKLLSYQGQLLSNYINNSTRRDYILPIEDKEMRIHFQSDSLKGPVYFDFCATRDSFLLFVYLHDTQEMEVWNFAPYRFMINKATYTNTSKTPTLAKDKWALLRTTPITLNGPFRIIHSRNRNYMITQEGEIFQLRTNTTEKSGRLPENTLGGALLIDKIKDEVFYIKAADGAGILHSARLGGVDKIRILKE